MEKNIIFYFSGTGNSLKIAKDIANRLENCELVLLTKFNEKILDGGYSRIGFVYPVYCADIPVCLKNFMQKTDFNRNKDAYFFNVVTGGGSFGNSSFALNEELEKQGLKLSSVNEVKMVGNYVALYDMPKEYGDVNKKVENSVEEIINNCINKTENAVIPTEKKAIKFVARIMLNKFANMDKHYNVDSSCNGCTTCKKVCSVQNIDMQNNKPVFLHKCEQCMACIQLCPQRAINYKAKTQKRGRYLNPAISIEELKVN